MSFFKKPLSQEEWEETPHGKKFTDRMRKIAEENLEKKREWERNADPARVAVYKRLKKVFPCVYIPFTVALFLGVLCDFFLYILVTEAALALAGLALFFFPPKAVIRHRTTFLFVPIAFVVALVCWLTVFSARVVESKVLGWGPAAETESESTDAVSSSGNDGAIDYETFIRDKVIGNDGELYDKNTPGGMEKMND